MGRNRQHHKHLPPRMRLSHGAYYYVPFVDGKQQWQFLSRDHAEAFAKYGKIASPAPVAAGDTVAQMIKRYLREELPKHAAATQTSYRTWANTLNKVFGHMPVASLTLRHMRRYRDEHPHLVAAQRQLSLLQNMVATAVEWGWLDVSPLAGFRKMPEPRRTRYITDDELAAILKHCGPIEPLVRFAAWSALRKSDLLSLSWGNVRDGVVRITTSKTASPMAFVLDAEMSALLASLKVGTAPFPKLPLFPSPRGKRLSDRGLDRYWWRACELAGITDVVFHDLRRKRITDLALKYGHEFAQRWASHRDSQTTARYFVAPEVRVELPILEAASKIRGSDAS